MKQHFIIKNNQKHLLLFFAGWGMDETPFLQIRPTNKDWLICYDYRSLEFDDGNKDEIVDPEDDFKNDKRKKTDPDGRIKQKFHVQLRD